ncbi:helix-turn-helix transcriptional regulator [Aeromonas media]|uniref:helix-turn-helix domain-containing protein n=1 Tax=Aeromonas TaxID=642 RepID=UPI000FA3C04C|nr:helix-turn-helix transcriptional regulator [Aeromonas media]
MNDIKSVINVTTTGAVLGAVLAELRTNAGMKQAELAAKVGVGSSTWSRIEKGESGISIDLLKAAAKVLSTTAWAILEVADAAEQDVAEHGVKIESTPLPPKILAEQQTKMNNKNAATGAGLAVVSTPFVGAALGSVVAGSVVACIVGGLLGVLHNSSKK